MPEYEFVDEEGRLVEVYMAMGAAPRIGESMVWAGKTLTRIVSRLQAAVQPDIRFESVSLPPNRYKTKHKSHDGQPQVSTRRERDNLIAQAREDGYEWTG